MAFQFPCSQCGAQIEVDDEYRDKKVTCPYCQKPVIASETPLEAPPAGEATATAQVLPPAPRPKSILGWIALAITIIAIASLITTALMFTRIFAGIDWKAMPQEERISTYQGLIAQHPALKVIGIAGGCVCPIAAVVLSIITIVKKYVPRWPAVLSLVLIGILLVLQCINIIMQGMAAAKAAGAGGAG